MTAFSSKWKYEKLAVAGHFPFFGFAKDGKQTNNDLQRMCTAIVLLI